MTQLTEEQRSRLKQIRERQEHNKSAASDHPIPKYLETAYADIDSLLSLLDSQAEAAFVGPCVHCGHNNYDAELGECKQRWMEGRMSVVCGCPCAKHNSLANAATRMRDLCVDQVRAMGAEWDTDSQDPRADLKNLIGVRSRAKADAAGAIVTALESLTLDQEQEKHT